MAITLFMHKRRKNKMNDKRKTYDELHEMLAAKYGTLPRIIKKLRSHHIGFNFTRERMTKHYTKKVENIKKMLDGVEKNLQKPTVSPKIRLRQEAERKVCMEAMNANRWVLNFIIARTEEEWEDIMQKTQYDK